ncbi:MAG: DUF58 domain-containing protein [Verrucomicrobia bacterium]|nr:DUF58 domain-containing protein [Verrucomicrobiota bacterium]
MFRRFFYHSYRRLFASARWLGRRFTRAGEFALGLMMLAAVIGADTNQTTAYQAFAFLAAMLGVSALWIILRSFGPGTLSVQRLLPRFGTAGRAVTYAIRTKNESPQPQRGVVLLEDLEDPRPSWQEFAAKPLRKNRDAAAWLGSLLGASRWRDLVARRQLAVIGPQAVPDLPPRGEVEVRVEFTPRRRGRVHFTGMTLARPDVFGMMLSHRSLPLSQSLLVLPKRYVLPPIAMPGTRQYQTAGVAQATSVGQSDEFVALRDYRPGDPLRHIHWKSVAKTDRLIVREHEDEFFVRHALILDTFAAGGDEEAFEEAVSVASSFVCTIQTQESLLDLLFVGAEAYCFTAGRGVGHIERMLEILAGVNTCVDKTFPELESLVLRHAPLVSGCVCVFLAWDEPRQRLVRLLQGLRVPLRVCVVTGAGQTGPLDLGPMKNEPSHFHPLRAGNIQEELSRW